MDNEFVKLATVTDDEKFRLLCAMLEDNNIAYYVKDQGEFMRIFTGFLAFEAEIFVAEENYEKAEELLIYFKED